jgi:hypothetical protein
VLDAETIEFLESGCSLVVGTVASDGVPFVTRGWGIKVVKADLDCVRLVLDSLDAVTLENLGVTGRVAVTAADVPTLQSKQLKGRAAEVFPAGDEDRATVEEFCDAFFDSVVATDGTDRRLLERLVPLDFVACDVMIDELYDQTPGPGAGSAVAREDT